MLSKKGIAGVITGLLMLVGGGACVLTPTAAFPIGIIEAEGLRGGQYAGDCSTCSEWYDLNTQPFRCETCVDDNGGSMECTSTGTPYECLTYTGVDCVRCNLTYPPFDCGGTFRYWLFSTGCPGSMPDGTEDCTRDWNVCFDI